MRVATTFNAENREQTRNLRTPMDVGPIPPTSPETAHKAALTVVTRCGADARLVLAMLGLGGA